MYSGYFAYLSKPCLTGVSALCQKVLLPERFAANTD
jgi:hypothetical protein